MIIGIGNPVGYVNVAMKTGKPRLLGGMCYSTLYQTIRRRYRDPGSSKLCLNLDIKPLVQAGRQFQRPVIGLLVERQVPAIRQTLFRDSESLI
jgi:hypothetical protein